MLFLKNKKAATMVVRIIIVVVILLVVAFSIVFIQNNWLDKFTQQTRRSLNEQEYNYCKEKGKLLGTDEYLDIDEDGFPDDCDNCVCSQDSGCDNLKDDEDKDKIADECDLDDSLSSGVYNKKCSIQISKRLDQGKDARCYPEEEGMTRSEEEEEEEDDDEESEEGRQAIEQRLAEQERRQEEKQEFLEKCSKIDKCNDYGTNEVDCLDNTCNIYDNCVPHYSGGIMLSCMNCPVNKDCKHYDPKRKYVCEKDPCKYGNCRWNNEEGCFKRGQGEEIVEEVDDCKDIKKCKDYKTEYVCEYNECGLNCGGWTYDGIGLFSDNYCVDCNKINRCEDYGDDKEMCFIDPCNKVDECKWQWWRGATNNCRTI